MTELTPHQIVAELDKYVIGQDDAKKSVAIALRNRWRRRNASEAMRDEIVPNNIIMIGPTGVGKTEIARRLAKLAQAPFIKVEATKFTEVGYVGRDVDSMIRDLTDIAVNLVKAEQREKVRDRAAELAEERILDLLIPPAQPRKQPAGIEGPGFVIKPEVDLTDVPEYQPAATNDEDLRERTRAKFREKLKNGEMDKREIELDVAADQPSMMQVFGPMGMEEMGMNLQDMFGGLGGKKKKKRRMKVTDAREVLTGEEAEKLVDQEYVTKESLKRVQESGIVFIDEIDKVAVPSSGRDNGSPDVSRQGVQRDLLPIVEGSTVTTKYGLVKTDHILFIASGAFHIAKPSDLIPEMQGRFPIRVELSSLTENDFVRILTEPENALLKQYQALLASEGVEIEFTHEAVEAIAKIAFDVNAEVENIGARRLHTILTTLLEDVLFEVPETIREDKIQVDAALVEERLAGIVRNRDLSEYVL
jgi:ATP-dependent HslUV protease ATP-binding subunit HslU